MATPSDVLWPCEPHTRAKHEILKKYLQRWFPILNKHNGRIIYIDGFAGPGRYAGGEPGSPLIAIEAAATHRKALAGELVFLFTEEDPARVEHLKSEIAKLKLPTHFKPHVEVGRFDEQMTGLLDAVDRGGGRLAPTFALIDPFGFSGIPFALLQRLMQKPRCEILVTFMVESINRWLEHPNDHIVKHIPEAFGTPACLDIAKSTGNRIAELRDLYQRQLLGIAKFVRYFEMRDNEGRVIYYLFFASNHALGHVKMKEAMFAVGDEGLYSFSDATDPSQAVLFRSDHAASVWPLIRTRFAGQEVLTDDILAFVNDETAFLATHMKAALKRHTDERTPTSQRVSVRPTKRDGKPWKQGTFPDGVYVTLPPDEGKGRIE